jgi:formylglycine-generating enzyme required for sulfatase activity
VVPKKLRSFDAGDADFFLDLLPGPRDRDGLPDSIRFWKTRIEETDADRTFAVGLLYGPSGCGKSSLVKAGLLPRLAGHVAAVYVEATPDDTEARLLGGIRKHCPDLPADLGLAEALAALRRGQAAGGRKVLLVLDQFEQFLHAHPGEAPTQLLTALRQCDGARVQALILIRDDFWLAVTRFLAALEIDLVQGHNTAVVDLFDLAHARKVLAAFGCAYGRLADNPAQWSREERAFLARAAAGLARDGRVVPVRLALFAEMVKSQPWSPAALKAVGGTEGVGVAFLEETFGSPSANPRHRMHQKAVRGVLRALLPSKGTDIKGAMRARSELEEASGYAGRPREFADLLRILDSELWLVTPTDPEGAAAEGGPPAAAASGSPAGRFYQLTHDYLVPALREWLTRKQKETWHGRAELRLAERAAAWQARQEGRHLPAWWEWLNIRLFTRQRDWTETQRQMMRRAGRYHGTRGLVVTASLLLLLWVGWEGFGWLEAKSLRQRLLTANTEEVPGIVKDMGPYRRWLDDWLREAYADADRGGKPGKQVHLSLALLPVDDRQVDYLSGRLLTGRPPEVQAIREGLRPYCQRVSDRLWEVLEDRTRPAAERLRAACALAAYAEDDGRWEAVGGEVAAALVAQDMLVMHRWADLLRPVRRHLLPPLADSLMDEGRGAATRSTIARLYSGYAEEPRGAFDRLEKTAAGKVGGEKADPARRQAYAAAALAVMGRWSHALALLRYSPDPTARSYLVRELGTMVEARELLAEKDRAREVALRQGLLLALGDCDRDRLSPGEREPLIPGLEKVYRDDPDPGIHGAAGWLLRQWGRQRKLEEIDQGLRGRPPADGRRWYVNGQGQTMVVIPPGEFRMGEGKEEKQERIDHRFALAAREVTVAEYLDFRKDHDYSQEYAPTTDCPVNRVSWYDAAAYCNWLSKQEGIPEEQWCYLPNDKGDYAAGMKVSANFLRRTGYRMPTEEEWEYACRAGSLTGWCMGDAEDLLPRYACYVGNAGNRTHPTGSLRPNDWGLFDLHGNVVEWCQGVFDPKEDKKGIEEVVEKGDRLVRGGSFYYHAVHARSAYRADYYLGKGLAVMGFRPARTLP